MRKILLVCAVALMSSFAIAQDGVRYIEIRGNATETVEPDLIAAEINFYTYDYDYGNTKDEQKFENTVMKLQEKMDLDKYAVDQEDLNSSCSVSYEKYINLEFSDFNDYKKVEEQVYSLSNDDLYIDMYLSNQRVSDDLKDSKFDALLEAAIDDAIEKAQKIATKMNFTIGDVLAIYEGDDYYDYYYDDYYYDDYGDYEGVELEKSVTIRFEIK